MRKLMWFTIGFTCACLAAAYLLFGNWVLLIALCGACGFVGLLFTRIKYRNIGLLLMVGLLIGSIWSWGFDTVYLNRAKQFDGERTIASATIQDYSYKTQYGVAADAKVVLDGQALSGRIYWDQKISLCPGDQLDGEFYIRLTTKDSISGETYHLGQGIILLAYADEASVLTPANKVGISQFAPWLRHQITQQMDKIFPNDTIAFSRALLLGDSSLLSYEDDTAFKLSGIRHIIAVSGLHVSILLSVVYVISGRRRFSTAVLGFPVLALFAAVAGFTPSVLRACIMQGLMILALLVKQEYDPPTALSFAVLVMLVVNPPTVTSVSFQLSVGCVAGILLFYEKINRYLLRHFKLPKGKSFKKRLCNWFCSSVSITLSTMITTTPLSAMYFGTVSLVGILTNLLTLWVVSFIFYGIILACVLGALWLPAGKAVAWVVSWPIRYVMGTAKLLAGFPISAVYTNSIYIVIWLIFCYALLTVLLMCRKKRPAVLAGCACAGLVLAIAFSWIEPRLDDCRVTVLDVGQGQAILLQHKGKTALIDCGGDTGKIAADTVANALLSQGIFNLDAAILTHYDQDHAAGMELLLTRITVDTLYLPDISDDGDIKDRLLAEHENAVCVSETVELWDIGAAIRLFPEENPNAGNESCMCILFQTQKCDILITGDRGVSGEQKLLQTSQLPKLELLVVGHHGSEYSTGFELLEETRPAMAVISVGAGNAYGHPSSDVLWRLALVGAKVLRTDLNGTIIFRG